MTLKVVSAGEEFLAERYLLATWREFLESNPDAERRVVDVADENAFGELIDALSPGLFGEIVFLIVDNIELSSEDVQKFFLQNWSEEDRPLTIVVQRSFVKG